jgi:hypothetical protein
VKLTMIAISDAVTRTVKIIATPPYFHVPRTVAQERLSVAKQKSYDGQSHQDD